MSNISFIDDHKVIDRIIRHLEPTFAAKRQTLPHHVQQELSDWSRGDGGVVDLGVFGVITLFRNVTGRKLREIVEALIRAQKAHSSYLLISGGTSSTIA